MRYFTCAVRFALVTGLASVCLWAHHSPSAEFDMTKRITLTGTLTKVDWTNPHIRVGLDVKGEGGKLENWAFESNPPAWFRRVHVSRSDFAKAVGQTVKVEGVRAKDGSFYGYLQKIILPDGSSLELVDTTAAQETGK
ncbi:MAG TPA: DUF6152 family protein [Bryobacteraceae bacterium]|nr:DUF6152 family protein [Bryobacteraceae bacterium]